MPASPHLIVCYRNVKAHLPGASHVGLGLNAMHTARVLGRHGIIVDVYPTLNENDIDAALIRFPDATHLVIEGVLRISASAMSMLSQRYPRVQFVSRCHSQVGFLQVEAGAIELILEYLVLQDGSANFRVAGNGQAFCQWLESTYRTQCLYLPNLYDYERPSLPPRAAVGDRTVKIGSFGAIRLMKHHTAAAAAAQMIAAARNADLEFWISSGREEQGRGVVQAIRNMFAPLLPHVRLVEAPWQAWGDFRRTIARMDLCLQMSSSETFNQVTADAVAEGVPCVVSPVIEWVPDYWKANIDDLDGASRIGQQLLSYPRAAADGQLALQRYVSDAIAIWLRYLG